MAARNNTKAARSRPTAGHASNPPPPPSAPPTTPPPPTQDEIRILAHHKWVAAGCPPGDGVPFWLEAEQELFKNCIATDRRSEATPMIES